MSVLAYSRLIFQNLDLFHRNQKDKLLSSMHVLKEEVLKADGRQTRVSTLQPGVARGSSQYKVTCCSVPYCYYRDAHFSLCTLY